MKIYTVYIADDGRKFETAEACCEYELQQRAADAKIKAFSDRLATLDWRVNMDSIQFIHFEDFTSLNIFNNVMDDLGYCQIPCFDEEKFVAWWEWNENNNEYEPLDIEAIYNRYTALKALYDKCIEIEGEKHDDK